MVAGLEARIAQLEARIANASSAAPPSPAVASSASSAPAGPLDAAEYERIFGSFVHTTAARPDAGSVLAPVGLVVSGYLQAQYESSQLSEDQIQQGGIPYNRDRFVLRRARLRVDGSWRYTTFALEIDANTVRTPTVGVRRAEGSLVWRNPDATRPPYAMLTVGLTDVPFGYELTEGNRRRFFMERSLGSVALFPGEPDLGVRLSGGVSFLRYALAVMNGTPLGDRVGANSYTFTAAKDVLGRIGVDTGTARAGWNISGGVSFLAGTGFHPGTEATKSGVIWRDANENLTVDNGELVGVPARAATASETFSHWAVNADLQARFRSWLGWTRVYGEFTLASNLDRGVLVADPVTAGNDVRQLSGYAAIVQDVTRFGVVGFRWDYYNANTDLLDNRRGALIPADAGVHTLSPLVGFSWPDRARLLFQYDVILDSAGRDERGVPRDLANNQWTLRAQVDF